MDLELIVAGEQLVLMPERAAYWPRRATLLIADTHWGKAATMRAAAIPVPIGTTREGLDRLSAALARTAAQRVVLLGDCIHAKQGRSDAVMAEVTAWRGKHPDLQIDLVRGNHDVRSGDPPGELRIRCVDPPEFDLPFVYRHYPGPSDEGYTLAGHLHPAVTLYGYGAERAVLPCFWFGPRVGVLPAFGAFTGTAKVRPEPGDRVGAIASGEVVLVSY